MSAFSKQIGLSEPSSVGLSVALEDIRDLSWLQTGMCWAIEQPDLGEELWAGFVSPEQLPLDPVAIPISLDGPKEALLSVEMAVLLPTRVEASFAIEEVILAAQVYNGGIAPGIIEPLGAAVELTVRAETASQFVDTLKSAAGLDWRERSVFSSNGFRFYLDFGRLERNTNIVLDRDDIVAGSFTRGRITSSVTKLGAAEPFADREVATVSAVPSGIIPSSPTTHLASQRAIDLARIRDIGPAATRHASEVGERVATRIPDLAAARHEELLRNVDEIVLTLDATKSDVQRIELGDVVRLEVPAWLPGFPVSADLHIRHMESAGGEGDLDIVATVKH